MGFTSFILPHCTITKPSAIMPPNWTIVPEITGRAYVTGLAQYLLDPEDPLGGGFLL